MPVVLDLADLAAEQWGLVTTAQARSLGVPAQAVARLTKQGALERMTHGVYRVAGAPPSSLDDLRAAWLALDPARRAGERLRDEAAAVVSHRSAAAIHEIGNLEADQLEFTSGKRKQTRRPDIRIHRGHIGAEEWTVVDGLPVTTVIRTVDDLAAAHIDGGHLASVARDALTRRQVDDRQLIDVLRRHAHRYGARMGDGEALVTRLLHESGIPQPIERAVEFARTQMLGNAGQLRAGSSSDGRRQLRQLSEQLTSIQRAIGPPARVSEQIANSPAMKAAADMVEPVQEPAALQELAKQHAALIDSPTMKAIAELARYARSPVMQHLARQHAEVAEVSRLAHTLSEAVRGPKAAMPETELRETEEG